MGIALYGNVNGHTYTPPQINLLDSSHNHRVNIEKVSDKVLKDAPAIMLNISEEGLKALHGSKLSGNVDPFETAKQIAFMSEHQPMQSFTSQIMQMMPKNYTISSSGEAVFQSHSIEEKETALIDGFQKMYDQISKEYDEGSRVRYIEDSESDDGYRKLSKDEELSILKKEFDDFVDWRFGDERKAQNEAVKTALNSLRELKKSLGRSVNEELYKIETIPDGFTEKLKSQAKNYAEKHGLNMGVADSFIKSIGKMFSPMGMASQKIL